MGTICCGSAKPVPGKTMVDLRLTAPGPRKVTLDKNGEFEVFLTVYALEGDKLGVKSDKLADGHCVTAVTDGLIEKWNQVHSSVKVEAGDLILTANGDRVANDPEKKLLAYAVDNKLRLRIRKCSDLGGYTVGQMVWYTGTTQKWDDGDSLLYGTSGTIVGPATLDTHAGKGVNVNFSHNQALYDLFYQTISDKEPAGEWNGFKLRQKVWFVGTNQKMVNSATHLAYGTCGEVVGPPVAAARGKGVAVLFAQSSSGTTCVFEALATSEPSVEWNGFALGQTVWYTGEDKKGPETLKGGQMITSSYKSGCSGEVSGPASSEDVVDNGLEVKFAHNSMGVDVPFDELSQSEP